jgi:hypothetical protein
MFRLIKGQVDAALFIPVLVGLLYAGTGGWTAERWNGALAIMGMGGALKAGFSSGYNTYNPNLHRPEQPRDDHGRFVRRDEQP